MDEYRVGILFVALAYLAISLAARGAEPPQCAPLSIDERVAIRYVIDGDTVVLKDGRKLRLIGIDTPELAHNGRPAEGYAEQARAALTALLRRHRHLALDYDKQRKDKHRRHLAHLFLDDGVNVQAWLLDQGLAITLIIPPNLQYIDCYRSAELRAINARRRIWALPQFQPVDASRLGKNAKGHRIVSGSVTRIGESASSIWINLGPTLALRILRKDLQLFREIDLKKLVGKKVIVRGWLYHRNNELRIQIRHPAYLRVINNKVD